MDSKNLDMDLKKAPKTVVCIHGFYRTRMNMVLISRSLKKDGCKVYNYRYHSRQKYINEHAEDLVRELIKIVKNKKNEPINFVTHSLGGLVLRKAVNHSKCPIEAKIGKAVLVAAPNKGSIVAKKLFKKSKLARFIFGTKAGFELMTKKDFDDLGDFPSEMKIEQIVGIFGYNPFIKGKNDGKVAYRETKLNTTYEQIDVKAGHSWICYSPKVIKCIKRFLYD